MTREQKLALIVGFALILVVGILISDHLSPASTDRPIEALAFSSPLGDLPPAVVIEEDLTRLTSRPEPENEISSNPEKSDAATKPRVTSNTKPFKPMELTQGVSRVPERSNPGANSKFQSHPDPDKWQSKPGSEARQKESAPTTGPGFNSHVVRKGETLSSIAKAYLGSASKWTVLARLNRDRVGADGSVRSGVTLRLPAHAAKASRPDPGASSTATTRTYTVRPGDTLLEIAQKELGTVKRADEIISLNSDKISDADQIYVGLVLKLPPR